MKNFFVTVLVIFSLTATAVNPDGSAVKKIKDVLIYSDSMFYSSFPSVVKLKNGELLVAFRRAPNRLNIGYKSYSHTDANSYLVAVRSKDGEHWSAEPELIYAHAFGGSQDPCLLQLRDGTLLCTSYGWMYLAEDATKNQQKPVYKAGEYAFLGGYIVRSEDQGKTWKGPYYPTPLKQAYYHTPHGNPLPSYNRGALYEGKSGRIYWAVAIASADNKTTVHLLVSDDKGITWKQEGLVASDEKASFNETSVYETPAGDIVAFLRTASMDDQACIARSTDGGKTFKWQSMGFQGHPLNALQLPDKRVLLTYGYRHEPFGIRCRILNAECTDFATAEEFVLRDDGGNGDIGYTWPVLLDKNRVLVTYYFNMANGIRYIAGTIIEI
ncbi:MAG: glycoside hydrolase [Tannerella sp.]|jgi:hypothetical protein|nr:glycoside hydrolase [Tannerella sp.]